ncbi:hypothetical protein NGRA_1177 [Nosema granulosis]|uniref:Uncharacterized protein n=1 Tax=Nosema granulosis TaxID=83296 RepID=A0A9P6GYY3_9MICR|nr:hypothetical protein NGRA_1177 [Nosema granulosis]
MSNCCGMSFILNFKTKIKNILFPNMIEGQDFILLNVMIFIVVIVTDYIHLNVKNTNRLLYSLISTGLYFIGWVLMMLSMSSNMYIILTILLAKFIGFYVSHRSSGILKKDICCI